MGVRDGKVLEIVMGFLNLLPVRRWSIWSMNMIIR